MLEGFEKHNEELRMAQEAAIAEQEQAALAQEETK